jgi:hypothetical protein
MFEFYCIGAYESEGIPWRPIHVPPIIAERGPDDTWRRVSYEIQKPYRLAEFNPIGDFLPIAELSVFRGDYVRCDPFALSISDQVVLCSDGSLIPLTLFRRTGSLFEIIKRSRPLSSRKITRIGFVVVNFISARFRS